MKALQDKQANSAFTGPLFVVGIWRSGTSLLYTLLNQHPRISLLYEADLPLLDGLFRFNGIDKAARWNFWNSSLERHDLGWCADSLNNAADKASAVSLIYGAYAARRAALIWGEKSPTYYAHLPRLASLFPQARFVVIWRDPKEICSSIASAAQRPGWFQRPGMMTRALLGCETLRKACDMLHDAGVPLFELTYRELTSDTTSVLQKLCRFIGVEFVPAMCTLTGADQSAIYDEEHHNLVRSGSIRSGEVDLQLPPSLQSKIERYICLWNTRYAGRWGLLRDCTPGTQKPTWTEYSADRIQYCVLRALDRFVTMVYCFAPLALLQGWRGSKPV